MPPFHLRTLGDLRLTRDGEEILARRRNQLVLLAYLADRFPRAVRRAELATLLWGNRDEGRARTSLRQALSKLRRALGNGIETDTDAVRLADGVLTSDVEQMESDLEAGRLQAAVSHWGGVFLEGAEEIGTESLRSWIDAERERLKHRYCAALEQLSGDAEQRGDWGAAVDWARRWVEADRLDERAHARLIHGLRLSDRPEEADSVHAAFTARLRQELELEPSPGFLRLDEMSPADSAPAAPSAPSSSSSGLFTPDLVGRADAFATLSEAWESVRGSGSDGPGPGTTILIEGEEGIGKSRLCEEFLRWVELSDREAFVLRARAYPVEPRRPWTSARQLLGGLHTAPGLSGAPQPALAAVSRLAPSIRERYRRLPPPDEVEVPLTEALARVLEDVSSEAPIVILLDDLPAADPSTQQLLAGLAAYPPSGVLLLLTARTGAPGTQGALDPFRTITEVRRIELRPLAIADVESLLASMVALDQDDRRVLARRLHEEANGNPFFTVALVSALADAEQLTPDSKGVWRLSSPPGDQSLPLPTDLRETVRARLDHLGPDAREVAGAAAVLEQPIEPALLEAVAGLSGDVFADAVEELLARGLLSAGPSAEGGYEFTHDLIGRVTYRLLSPSRRQALHRDAYEAMSGIRPVDEAVKERLHYHRERAGRFVPSKVRRRWIAVATLSGLAAAVTAAMAISGGRSAEGDGIQNTRDAAPSLAVLYLDNLSRDTLDAYLAEGFTEEIASRLSMLDRLRVKSPGTGSRAQQGETRRDPVALGESLDVEYLVEGSVRRAGQRLRVSVHLTNALNGFRVWSGTYDAASPDILVIQDSIAAEIATRIAGQLTPRDRVLVERRVTDNPEAYDHFLRGNYHLVRRTPESVLRAIEEYQRAARVDPGFSSAFAREAYGYALFLDWGWTYPDASPQELLARGLLMTERVLQRDSLSADAWMARAYLLVLRDPLRHDGAPEAFRRSIALDPGNAEAHHQLGQSLMTLGHMSEARAAYRRALEIEPRRAMTLVPLAAISVREGRHEQARQISDSAVAAGPSVPYAYAARGLQALGRGDAAGARRDAETALALDHTYPLPARAVLTAALAGTGHLTEARRELAACLELLADPIRPTPTETLFLAIAMLALGDSDGALDLIERTRPRGAWLWFYLQDPQYDDIRDHPRFQRIIQQVTPLPPPRRVVDLDAS